MKASGSSVKEILENIPVERKKTFSEIHKTIMDNLPLGFEAGLSYGGLGYIVPHKIYPRGYHCNPKEPLPFAGLANQKHSINFYHLGLYALPELDSWFQNEYLKCCKHKMDRGKSCIRFKHFDDIPLGLIGLLISKISVQEWIRIYEEKTKI